MRRQVAWTVLNDCMMHILAPLDGSPLAETILPFVQSLTRRSRGRVTLLYVAPGREGGPRGVDVQAVDRMARRDRELAESYLQDQRRRLTAAGIDADVAVATGRPAPGIVGHAEQAGVDLVALSTHGRSGVQAWAHGSVADEVLHTSRTPVLLVRPGDRWTVAPHDIERVIVPLDGSDEAEAALRVAEPLAARGDLPMALIRCVEPMSLDFVADQRGVPYIGMESMVAVMVQEARDYLEAVAGRLRRRGLAVTTQVSVGAAAPCIAAFARSSAENLVVLATHARTGWRRVLVGSVARRIAHSVPTPVILCPVAGIDSVRETSREVRSSDAVAELA
jgi:nucleotide-binding universal stress UspA family protein